MAITMHVDIVSAAEASIFSGRAEMVIVPGEEGELGIAPMHAALLTRIAPGPIRLLLPEGKEEVFYINGGFLEVQPDVVTILGDSAVRAGDLDEAKAIEARKQAEAAIANKDADLDYSKAQAELIRAVAQLRTIQELRKSLK